MITSKKYLSEELSGEQPLQKKDFGQISNVSAQEIIQRIKSLPSEERAKIATYLLREDTSWIPEDFQAAMADLANGRLVDMETALHETPPPDLR